MVIKVHWPRKAVEWLYTPFNAHTPALHSCTFCEAENKPHIGQNIAWCRLNKTKREVNQEPNQRVKPSEQNSPRRKLNQQSTTGEQTSPSRESNQREQRSPHRELDPRENYPHNKFGPLTIDESEGFSTPESEFRKQARTGRLAAKRDNNHISAIEAPSRYEVLRKPSKLDNINEKTKQTEQDHPSIISDKISKLCLC